LRNRQSLLTWGIVLAIIIGSALLTVMWPTISGIIAGGGTSVPSADNSVVIPLPVPIGGRNEIVTSSGAIMGLIAFLVIGAVVTTGIVFAIISWLSSRIINRTTSTPSYQAESAALQRSVDTRVKAKRAERPTHAIPNTTWERWAKVTTTLSVLMLVAFGTWLIASSVFPQGSIIRGHQIINIVGLLVLVSIGIALIAMFLWFRRRQTPLTEVSAVESGPIPWDFIAVALTGLLVVGLGLGLIAWLNS
jgi:hypothetical protein